MSGVKAKGSKPWWWKRLWMGVLLTTFAFGVVGYFLFRIPLERIVGGMALTFLCVGTACYIRVRPSMKVNRVLYITLGALGTWVIVFFGGAFIILATGLPPPTNYLGPGGSFILLFIAPYIIGAFIGDWIGRRRNYLLPLGP